ncbi:hypothetical protein G7046_g9527 [Stylonectria norvegica]|nr:hypothetical protein G7046_g9527 [Stylonectria norvegica]
MVWNEKKYEALGKPGIFRNDRFWIAGDHVVEPSVMTHPRIKPLIDASERARKVFKLTEYQGMNYTIMHTKFCRERAQPGMLIIGSDSHTCSAGSVSSLAIGLGVADLTLPLVTGETWIEVPETVEIRFVNKPRPGLGGKNIILYILKELKRNTVAAERIVEYTALVFGIYPCGTDLTRFRSLVVSCICVPDDMTVDFISHAETHIIDRGKVELFVTRYPSPHDVVAVGDVAGTALDGCFIGACTTAREDLILAGLVLEAGLKKGLRPVDHGKRKLVPGSRPILHELEERVFAVIYRQAGFEIGVPGCTYCVGMSADTVGDGEVWLTSQNRNFENRMGPDSMDTARLQEVLGTGRSAYRQKPHFIEPATENTAGSDSAFTTTKVKEEVEASPANATNCTRIISGKVQTLGDFIDTDALAPAEALLGDTSAEEIGKYCLYHTHPDFRRRVREDSLNIVVPGKAFGVESSRENAVTALQCAGVQCAIARSFAFIYARNQPNLGLLGIVMKEEKFYQLAKDGADIEIHVSDRTLKVGGEAFSFSISQLEIQFWEQGSIRAVFAKWGKGLLKAMSGSSASPRQKMMEEQEGSPTMAARSTYCESKPLAGAYDISYDAWNYAGIEWSATEEPQIGGCINMNYEAIHPGKCSHLYDDAANSMNSTAWCMT